MFSNEPRIKKLASIIVNYSCKVQPGENFLIQAVGPVDALTIALIQETYRVGGVPFVWKMDTRLQRELLMNATEEQLKLMAETDAALMSKMQAFCGIRAGDNLTELCDVPSEKMDLYNRLYSEPVHGKIRVPKTKWVVMRYPTPSMAQQANMSTAAFEDYFFNVCCLDYSRMYAAMLKLKELMERTDKVRITGPGTDLTFSIKGIPAIPCAGEMNLPDGEIFTAPVKDSVNGVITYNTPSPRDGFVYENVCLKFKDGKIIEATANDTERINKVFDTDEGARYVGEFAIGVNPYITKPMKDILFDEKIAGSIHFTPGSSYDEAPNGNKSAVHWDLVLIQTPEWGGGEIWFDDVLIRKDGRFVTDELACLNPENLV
ncbi:MAG: aminopeptidase [Christensenellales bacterium]|jgi:aminopeptidase